VGARTGQTRAVTAQRNKTIHPETLGKNLSQTAADRRSYGTQDRYGQFPQRLLEAREGRAGAPTALM
jgi:hypothetical protein